MKLKSLLHKSSYLSLCLALLMSGLSIAPVLANDPPPPPENSQPTSTETFPELFSLETDTSFPLSSDPTILREQTVTLYPDVLPFSNSAAELSPLNVDLNLFSDVRIHAELTPGDLTISGNRIWSGKAVGLPESSILFITAPDGSITGNIDVPGAHYQIRPDSGSLHRVEQIDTSAFPAEEEVSSLPGSLLTVEPQSLSAGQADDGSTIDVMIMYSPQARIAEGGTAKMLQLIDLAVSETNQAYINSGIAQRIRLVYTGETSASESGNFNTDLSRLTFTDGYMDEVQQLRNDYRADLVSLIVKNPDYCGLSWMMSSLSSSFESRAYSVVSSDCATGNYSLAHEMGHNMGAAHDWYTILHNSSDHQGVYSYSEGYVASNNAWRTIMAYPTACSNCQRLLYFSNPDIYYGGLPMGVAEGNTYAADNRKTLNNTAYTVANFRLSQGAVPTTPTTLSPSGTINTALPTFSWYPVSSASQYILTVNNISAQAMYTLTLNASEVCGASSCTTTPGTTLNPGTYSWYLQASSTNGVSPASVGKTFTIVLPLSTPVLISPEGNLASAQPTFKWQEVSGANQYSLVVRDSSGTTVIEKSQISQSVCSGSTCSYDTGAALYKGNFTWIVMAFNTTSSASSNWSAQKAFNLQVAPAAPVPASPTGKIYFDMPLYTWPPVKGAATYTLAVNSSSGAVFSPIALQAANVCTATLCQYSPAVRLPRGAYTWTLKASNEYGDSPASSTSGFTVQWLARLPFISK
jgi:hypothetical protein